MPNHRSKVEDGTITDINISSHNNTRTDYAALPDSNTRSNHRIWMNDSAQRDAKLSNFLNQGSSRICVTNRDNHGDIPAPLEPFKVAKDGYPIHSSTMQFRLRIQKADEFQRLNWIPHSACLDPCLSLPSHAPDTEDHQLSH